MFRFFHDPLQREPEPDLMGDLLGGDDEPPRPPQPQHAPTAGLPPPPAAAPDGDLMGAQLRYSLTYI
jgi:hypothetical protein